jgi:hypothetical protein
MHFGMRVDRDGARSRSLAGARSMMRCTKVQAREHVLAMYEFTCQLATLAPPPPEMQQLFGSIQGNQPAMNRFVQMNAGTISPTEFFATQH